MKSPWRLESFQLYLEKEILPAHYHRLGGEVISFVFLFLSAMEFHEHLHSIGTKEGLKERKLQKAVESFTWNITILKVFSELFLMLVMLHPCSACFFLLVYHFLHCTLPAA